MTDRSKRLKISLSLKFFSVVCMFVLICVLIGAVGLWKLSGMKNQIQNIVDNSAEKIMLATAVSHDLLIVAMAEKNMLISEDESEMQAYAETIAQAQAAIKAHMKHLSKLCTPEEKKMLAEFETAFGQFMAVNRQVTELTLQNTNFKAALLSENKGIPLISELDQHVDNILVNYEEEFKEAASMFDAMYLAEVGELMQRSARLLEKVKELQTTSQAIILSRTEEKIKSLIQQLSDLTQSTREEFEFLDGKINEKNKADFEAARNIFTQFTSITDQISRLASQNSNEKAFDLSKSQGRALLETAEATMAQLVEQSKAGLIADRESSDMNFKQAWAMLMGIAAAGILIGVILAAVIIRQLMAVLKRSFAFARQLSNGDFTSRLAIRRDDELGDLADHLDGIAQNVGDLIKNLMQGIEHLTASSTGLSELSLQMTTNAGKASEKSSSVSSAANDMTAAMSSVAQGMTETASNLATVAAAAEEMTATVNGVAGNTTKARETTDDAVAQTREAKTKVEHLDNAAEAIGKVTETITDISEQTNLLALNATIEAARAGEAGKGFAVVASEIKDLAGQTARATEEIKKEIRQIQDETGQTVDIIGKVTQTIFNVNELTATIAAAIEEQSATTREISSNINLASEAGRDISQSISQSSEVTRQVAADVSHISTMSDGISDDSAKVDTRAEELSRIARDLQQMAARFTV